MSKSIHILFVDDEENVRDVGRKILEYAGFSVICAASGSEALQVFAECGNTISCVVLDLTMPDMDGKETFRQLKSRRADLPIILSSGYNEQEAVSKFVGRGLSDFLKKPYPPRDLTSKVVAAIVRHGQSATQDAE